MPRYDYHCPDHGDFEKVKPMVDHAWDECPTCGATAKQVLRKAPALDTEGMADAGCPGAFEKSGDRLTRRHREAGQAHDPRRRVQYEGGLR